MDGIFDLHINFIRVQFEAKVLVTCTNLVQCCAVVNFLNTALPQGGEQEVRF